MSTVHAFAIHQIGTRIAGKKTAIRASEKGKPSVFITTRDELAKLEALGAAREATKEEVAIAKAQEAVIDASVKEAETAESKAAVDEQKPASGAAGDPQSRKSKAAEPKAAEPQTESGASGATGANDSEI